MRHAIKKYSLIAMLVTGCLVAWMLPSPSPLGSAHAENGIDGEQETETIKGPQGGRLLANDTFLIEITIFEKGMPPEFHVYAYQDGILLSPAQVDLKIEPSRLGGQVDLFNFSPQEGYLRGDGIETEPHSFDVTVTAGYQGKVYRWSYENYEGRTRIGNDMSRETGIETEHAGPGIIHQTVNLTGRIQTNPNLISQVRPRFPGVVQTVHRNLGDDVSAGDILATVQSNESLQTYSVRAPIGGLIVRRDIQVGESTGGKLLFTIADLSRIWAELDVFSRDLSRVRPGQSVIVETFDGYQAMGTIDWVSPLVVHASQSVRARVSLPNPDGRLRPGQFVRGKVTVAKHDVPLAVRKSALQRFRDFQVVFARFGDAYEVRMLDLGRSDETWIEVLGGMTTGTEYVTKNSYLIKADIEKSGASHDH